MRRSIRLALPVVAAASALVLTGCGDDSEPPFGVSAEDMLGDDGADLPDLDSPDAPDVPDVPDIPEFDEDDLGSLPTQEGYDGSWYVDLSNTTQTHNLDLIGSNVTFYEDLGAEGDVCRGTFTDNSIAFASCSKYGTEEWTDMTASVEFNDDGTMTVTWASGLEETYHRQG